MTSRVSNPSISRVRPVSFTEGWMVVCTCAPLPLRDCALACIASSTWAIWANVITE
jgi:hypothetical protein